MSRARIIRHNAKVFAAVAAGVFSDQRAGDQYAALLVGAYNLVSDQKVTVVEAEAWITQFDPSSDKADVAGMLEGVKCLNFILQQVIRNVDFSGRKVDLTVGELVDMVAYPEWDGDEKSYGACAKSALGRIGLKVDNDGLRLLISNTADGMRRLLKDTPWANDWQTTLARIKDAKKTGTVYFGAAGSQAKAVSVPLPKAVISSGME